MYVIRYIANYCRDSVPDESGLSLVGLCNAVQQTCILPFVLISENAEFALFVFLVLWVCSVFGLR